MKNIEKAVPLEDEYMHIYDCYETHKLFLTILKNGKWGATDLDGEILLPFEYDDMKIHYYVGEKTFFVVQKNGKYGVINLNEKIILPFEYDDIQVYYDEDEGNDKGLLIVKKNQKYGAINWDGKMILPFDYDDRETCEELLERFDK